MNQTKEVQIIQLAVHYIKNDNIQGLTKALQIMPLSKLHDTNTLLALFLSTCAKYNRSEAAKVVLKAWDVIYPEIENIPLLSQLFTIPRIDLPTLSFTVLSYEDYTYLQAMVDLITADNSADVIVSCSKVDSIFGKQPYTTYEIIRDHAVENENYKVEEYAIMKMRQFSPFAPIPDWVQNFREDEKGVKKPIPTEQELDEESRKFISESVFEIPSTDEAVELLTSGLRYMGLPEEQVESAEELIREKYSFGTRTEKIALLASVMQNQANQMLSSEKELFRNFGPANPLVNQDLTDNTNINNLYGGCRMLLCNVFDYDEEDDYVVPWFTGTCDQCLKHIRYKWHAIRRPRPHGGWIGEFCSFSCLREYIIPDEPDLVTNGLIDQFEIEFEALGIQERKE